VKAERQLVALLSMPLSKYDPVTVLSLDRYPALMALMAPRTHKDMAIKVVQTVLAQVTKVIRPKGLMESGQGRPQQCLPGAP
jgi:vacuolar protein sorting-associated protein 35